MKTIILIGLAFLTPILTRAQFTDNFNDGDFSNNPSWLGNTDRFTVNPSNELQLSDSEANDSYLYSSVSVADSTLWEFYFRLDFSPSSSNRLTIVLQSDNPDFSGSFQGYILRIGASGSDDAIELRRQNGSSSSLIAAGSTGAVASNPEVRARVIRDAENNWSLLVDYSGGSDFTLEASGTDDSYPQGAYFGFLCEYTVSNAAAFFFDDIFISPVIVDDAAAVMEAVEVLSNDSLRLSFNEALETSSAENPDHYSLDNGISVTTAGLNPSDPSEVILTLMPELSSGQTYELTSSGIADLNENVTGIQTLSFEYFEAEEAAPFDLIINELFPDFNPAEELPEAEFIELYNRSDKVLNLEGMRLADPGDTVLLPDHLILPDRFLILCDQEDVDDYAPFGPVLGLNTIPSLNNSSDIISLIDTDAELLHQIAYTSNWYGDDDKKGGGWTLELINPGLVCLNDSTNWTASIDARGGTPGTANSVLSTRKLELVEVFPESEQALTLSFNTVLNSNAADPSFFSLQGGAGPIQSAQFLNDPPTRIRLEIGPPLMENQQAYTLMVGSDVSDCLGAPVDPNFNSLEFTYYELKEAEPFDLVISEIMAKPEPIVGLPLAEYVEIFNRADRAINLEGLGFADSRDLVRLPRYILPPGAYVSLCEKNNELLLESFGPTLGLEDFPGLNNTGEELSVTNADDDLLFSLEYTDDWHTSSNKAEGGYSLELINPNQICLPGDQNWTSSSHPLGGSPGQQNSVYEDAPDDTAPALWDVVAFAEDSLLLFFSEPLDFSAADPSLFSLSGGAGEAVWAAFTDVRRSAIIVAIDAPFFLEGQEYSLSIDVLLTDCVGNPVDPSANSATFTYKAPEVPAPFDILINEIMADPTLAGGGSVGLPELEYLELYNRSEKAINLHDLILSDLSKSVDLPVFILEPGEFVILHQGETGPLSSFGRSFGLPEFPELGNLFDQVQLSRKDGEIIHHVFYSIGWYQDSQKDGGGWSLELINPENACEFSENWRASVSPLGGTPGAINSVLETEPDEQGPDLLRAFPVASNQVRLYFNEAVDRERTAQPDLYEVNDLVVIDAFAEPPSFNTVLLTFDIPIEAGILYHVKIQSGFQDCLGNAIGLFNSTPFQLPDRLLPGAIVVNELLFNPDIGGVDFIELYNRTDSVFNIGDLQLANLNEEGELNEVINLEVDYLLFPREYAVLTPGSIDIQTRYDCRPTGLPACGFSPSRLITTPIPAMPNDEGSILIRTNYPGDSMIVDAFAYSEDYHNDLLDDESGVSLERIDPNAPTQAPDNWQSAAQSLGYATPTYQNSQFFGSSLATGTDEAIFIPEKTFSPDGDGYRDFLRVDYQLQQGGSLANVRIFDARGRQIKDLLQNAALEREGFFTWDGSTDQGGKARIGVYVLWIELFDANGDVRRYKKSCVLAGRLD
jgi:hypothetical protein